MTTSSLEDFEKMKFDISEHNKTYLDKAKTLKEEIEKFYDCSIEIKHQENAIEIINIFLRHEFLKLQIYKSSSTKKYCIYCVSLRDLKNITDYSISSSKTASKEPNAIGVLNTKKIKEWIVFWEKVYNKVSEIDSKHQKEKDIFLKSLENFTIKWTNDKTHGTVKLNGLIFSFRLEPTHIRKEIKLDNNIGHEFKTFVKLSNNQLNAF